CLPAARSFSAHTSMTEGGDEASLRPLMIMTAQRTSAASFIGEWYPNASGFRAIASIVPPYFCSASAILFLIGGASSTCLSSAFHNSITSKIAGEQIIPQRRSVRDITLDMTL